MDLLSEIAHAVCDILTKDDFHPDFGMNAEVIDVEQRRGVYHVLLAFDDECYERPNGISQLRAFVEVFVSTDFGVDCVCEDVSY